MQPAHRLPPDRARDSSIQRQVLIEHDAAQLSHFSDGLNRLPELLWFLLPDTATLRHASVCAQETERSGLSIFASQNCCLAGDREAAEERSLAAWICGPPSLPTSNVVRLRRAKGLSQEALAYEASVNRSYLARVETAQPYVGLEVIGKLAEALEVEPAELLKLPSRRRS